MKTFWILWHFDTLADAIQCAKLTMDRPGDDTMFIMKVVGGIETTKKQKYVLANADRPPKKARVVRLKKDHARKDCPDDGCQDCMVRMGF